MFPEKLSILLQSDEKLAGFAKKGWLFLLPLVGLLLIGFGILAAKVSLTPLEKVEIISPSTLPENFSEIIVEVTGEVNKPGVYHLPKDSRIEDLLFKGDGFTKDADSKWITKNLNRAAKLVDGQKLYIPNQSEVLSASVVTTGSTTSNSIIGNSATNININSASKEQLESLSGIGPVYAQKIIDNRPYSDISELTSKRIIPQKTFDKIKDQISVY